MVDGKPGVILRDGQGWLFDGDDIPRPVTRSEARSQGGEPVGIDEAAELFSLQPKAIAFLTDLSAQKKSELLNSIAKINRETSEGVSPTTVAAATQT